MAATFKILLLILGLPLCILAVAGAAWLMERANESLEAQRVFVPVQVVVSLLTILFFALAWLWLWLLFGPRKEKTGSGFEVLPPKESR